MQTNMPTTLAHATPLLGKSKVANLALKQQTYIKTPKNFQGQHDEGKGEG
jgi:hypothetical protein